MDPFYIHIPSVRAEIIPTLSKWFVHAAEAKGIGESGFNQIIRTQKEPLLGRQLKKIASHLKERGSASASEDFNADIHFVIADNSAYFHEKPIAETHTPNAVQLSNLLNNIGNSHGIFVHIITPAEMEMIMPPKKEILSRRHPLFHADTKGNVKTSPGAATNIALSYIRTYHPTRYKGRAYFLRVGDDTYPSLRKSYGNRNFFLDMKDHIEGRKSQNISGKYNGYNDNKGVRVRPNQGTFSRFIVRHQYPADMIYYQTVGDEDANYTTRPHKTYFTPNYMYHGGRTTTLKTRPYKDTFGGYVKIWQDSVEEVRPVKAEFIDAVMAKNGIEKGKK
ncbi:MAG: hypothetical protein AABX01_07360 [Candidatus Micrarchaeota archaeon]